jgi:hypothetical protein
MPFNGHTARTNSSFAAIRSHTFNLYFFQLLTESFQIQNFYRLSAFPACAIGDSPIPTRVAQLIVKTVPALIYRNEPLVTIKVNIGKTKMRIYGFEFGTLKGLEQITKLVTLFVKGEEHDCLGIMLTRSFKENYYEDAENSIVGRGTVICWNSRRLPGRICSPQ